MAYAQTMVPGVGTVDDGDMTRRNVTTTTDTGQTSRIVTLDTSSKPFTFNTSNATATIDSGMFNVDYQGSATDGKYIIGITQEEKLVGICSQDS